MQPSDICVMQGHTYTCTATDGYPPTPSYTINYWSEAGSSETVNQQSYEVGEIGSFSVVCVVNYTHQQCPHHFAACHASINGTVLYGQYRRFNFSLYFFTQCVNLT